MRQLSKSMFVALLAILCWYMLNATIASGEMAGQGANFAGEISSAVTDKVRDELTAPGREIESITPEISKTVTAPKEYDEIEVTIPKQGRLGDRIMAGVTISKDGRPVTRYNIPVVVKMTMEVAVAATDLKRGTLLEEKDVVMEKRPGGAGMEKYITDIADVLGKQIDRTVKAGATLRTDQLQKPKLVTAGSPVIITAESGSIKITTMGRAKQDGDKGDWVRVTNTDTKKTFEAKVTAPGEVTVEF